MRNFILKTFFLSAIFFGFFMAVFFCIIYGLPGGIVAGLASGILFGFIISIFALYQQMKFKKIGAQITNGKQIILDGGANHLVGLEGVGGWLFLTPDEIIFKSHAINIQVHELRIPLDQIAEVKAVSNMGVVPNGLMIVQKDGSGERFVINGRKLWMKEISKAQSTMLNSPDKAL